MPSVIRQNRTQRIIGCLTERWKTKFVNIQFPWLWAIRQDWNWAVQSGGTVFLDLKVETIEKSKMFKQLLNLHAVPAGELWVHYFWGDGSEGVVKVDFNGVDCSSQNALTRAIWHSTHKLLAHIVFLEEEGECRKVTVFRSNNEWGMDQALQMMVEF